MTEAASDWIQLDVTYQCFPPDAMTAVSSLYSESEKMVLSQCPVDTKQKQPAMTEDSADSFRRKARADRRQSHPTYSTSLRDQILPIICRIPQVKMQLSEETKVRCLLQDRIVDFD